MTTDVRKLQVRDLVRHGGSPISTVVEVSRALSFACDLAKMTSLYFHVAVGARTPDRNDDVLMARWAGTVPGDITTRAPWIAPLKAVSLMRLKRVSFYEVVKTPRRGCRFKGGLHLRDRALFLTVAISKLDPALDELMAALIMYRHMYATEGQCPLELVSYTQDSGVPLLAVNVTDVTEFVAFMASACGVALGVNNVLEIRGIDDPNKSFLVHVASKN